MKFRFILISFTYATSSEPINASRGVPQYISSEHLDYVNFTVSTLFGIVSFNFDLPGLYEESTPEDFEGVSEWVKEGVDAIFESVHRSRAYFLLYHGPISLYEHNFEIVSMQPNISLLKADVHKVSTGLSNLHKHLNGFVFSACEDRLKALGSFTHAFSKMLAEAASEFQGHFLRIHSDYFKLDNSFTNVSLKVTGHSPLNKSVDKMVHLFDHNTLNNLISSEDVHLSHNMSLSELIAMEDTPIIGVHPVHAKRVFGTLKIKVSIDHAGRIGIDCNDNRGGIILKVGDRNRELQKARGLGNLRYLNWDHVVIICSLMKQSLYD